MKNILQRPFVEKLRESQKRHRHFIQVILGPRQVGKTTGIRQYLETYEGVSLYASADGEILKNKEWFLERWIEAKSKSANCLLVVDEIQKVENWAEIIKLLWDEQASSKNKIRLVLLGSSSLELQKGLSESLAGRFILHKVFHWNPTESRKAYQLSLEEYLKFGGYPASYSFKDNRIEWLNYLENSIIDPVIGKDILSIARVKSAALFKQCFDLICSYSGQEISYTKLLGQLQDKGNTDLVKHYLELFEQAFLIKQLFKFSRKKVLSRSSSPKIIAMCPALYSVSVDADYDTNNFGRAFESMLGAQLCELPGELFYWREKNFEVDFVLKFGKKLWAIETKWNDKKLGKGLLEFKKNFKEAELILMTPENYDLEIEKIKKSL